MSLKGRIEEVLPGVARPARYCGGELNSVRKPPEAVSVRTALAFPDIYEIGMSNLGLRILYDILNREPQVAAERVFAPAPDMEEAMGRVGLPLFSLESALPLGDFDLVGFSLAYELTYTTVLEMLDLAGVPVFARDRTNADPVVIAGGHCATNPEPMAEFVDAFVIGDGEDVVLDLVRAYEASRGSRQRILEAFAGIEGVYVPSIHGVVTPRPRIRARVVLDLERAAYPEKLVVPFTETVHDRAALEIMRGCSRGCRFCQAGMITRPVRERSLAMLCGQAQTILDNTGYEEIALTSLSSADHSQIAELVRALIGRHSADGVGVSLPSLRADAECVHLAAEISRVRKSGLTFAPEAGTQRLRDVINKNVTESDLLEAVEAAIEAGWRRVKLYFMIGLPTETDEDLRGIAGLVHRVADIGRGRGRSLTVSVTISPFVPKPHTPFQWRAMDAPEELERKVALLTPLLRRKGISLSWHDPKSSRVEAALARGDARASRVIHGAWKRGAKLEQENFDYARWLAAFEVAGLDIADLANAELARDGTLPWDHIDMGVSKEFLAAEDAKADLAVTTPDCRLGICANCGVRESTGSCPPAPPGSPLTAEGNGGHKPRTAQPELRAPQPAQRILFTFRKTPGARWLGHLDLQRVFERALRMARLPVAYSQGFNPRPKMSIASALPLGATADAELVTISLLPPFELRDMLRRLNARLPEGIRLTGAQSLPAGSKGPTVTASEYAVDLDLPEGTTPGDVRHAVVELLGRESLPFERESGGTHKAIDLRPGIAELAVQSATGGHARLVMCLPHREFTVKPSEVVSVLSSRLSGIQTDLVHRLRLVTRNRRIATDNSPKKGGDSVCQRKSL